MWEQAHGSRGHMRSPDPNSSVSPLVSQLPPTPACCASSASCFDHDEAQCMPRSQSFSKHNTEFSMDACRSYHFRRRRRQRHRGLRRMHVRGLKAASSSLCCQSGRSIIAHGRSALQSRRRQGWERGAASASFFGLTDYAGDDHLMGTRCSCTSPFGFARSHARSHPCSSGRASFARRGLLARHAPTGL